MTVKGNESHAFRLPVIESVAGDFRSSNKGNESHAFRLPVIESAAGDFRSSNKGDAWI
jgi:hypothetical protein